MLLSSFCFPFFFLSEFFIKNSTSSFLLSKPLTTVSLTSHTLVTAITFTKLQSILNIVVSSSIHTKTRATTSFILVPEKS